MASITCVTGNPPDWLAFGSPRPAGPVVVSLSVAGLTEPPAALLRSLPPDEQRRADRYRQPADRLRFLYGRILLRWVGAGLTGCPAQTVPLETGPYGKPDFTAEMGWHSNLSHAGEWVLLALDRHPVGIDVEACRADLPTDTLLPTVCSAVEQTYVRASADPLVAFLRLWTRKEALLKAVGKGLVDTLPGIPSLDGRSPIPADLTRIDGDWQTVSFWVDQTHPAALTYRPIGESPVFLRLTALDLLTNQWRA